MERFSGPERAFFLVFTTPNLLHYIVGFHAKYLYQFFKFGRPDLARVFGARYKFGRQDNKYLKARRDEEFQKYLILHKRAYLTKYVKSPKLLLDLFSGGNLLLIQALGLGVIKFKVVKRVVIMGHLDILQWIHGSGIEVDYKVYGLGGHNFRFSDSRAQDILKDVDGVNRLSHIYRLATEFGHFHIILWLEKNIFKPSDNWWRYGLCARNGHFEIVKHIVDNYKIGREINVYADLAAQGGYIEIIKWLLQKGACFDKYYLLNRVAKFGHLDIIKWIRANDNSILVTKGAFERAISRGHIETAEYLYGISPGNVDLWAIDEAIRRGHINSLKWLKEKGLMVKTLSWFIHYIKHSDIEIVKWLFDNTPLSNEDKKLAIKDALYSSSIVKNTPVYKWLEKKLKELKEFTI